jgi:hypothetical protein
MITAQQIEQLGVHPLLGNEGEGWWIEQNPQELSEFLNVLPDIKTALEIGTGFKAGFARFMSQVMGWQVTTFDINGYGHSLPGVAIIVADTLVTDEKFDLVFIDGDHHYESVKRDYEAFSESATKVIAFHDIAGLRDCEGVAKLWKEVAYKNGKHRKGCYEAIAEGNQRSGIGWMVKHELR